jgi:hypothetical protein
VTVTLPPAKEEYSDFVERAILQVARCYEAALL